MSEILVLYYSKGGSVKEMASLIGRGINSVNCDIFWSAIIFFNYTTLNLNYGSLQSKDGIHFRVGYGYERVILAQEV